MLYVGSSNVNIEIPSSLSPYSALGIAGNYLYPVSLSEIFDR